MTIRVKVDGEFQLIAGPGGAVESVNGQTGEVVLDAETIPVWASYPQGGTILEYIDAMGDSLMGYISTQTGYLYSNISDLQDSLNGIESRIQALEAAQD